ncbi:hypothetical protein TD95_000866 [Thielaviopsis punctulata]|uniref:Carboxylic ester hydrolase n=1 Tax=Thielaviopsis punctulata TaxID=72032 RepID=A0A0F4Z8T9_9PEZI|nr:hypothetical protein TD95_000866 [Thielaviopsis punctulata]
MDTVYEPLPSTPTQQSIKRRYRLLRVVPERYWWQVLVAGPGAPGVPYGTPEDGRMLLGKDGQGPIVNLGYVKYQGLWQANGIAEFTGMRYAKAPLGELRWRAPEDPGKQHGLRRATQFGKACHATGRGLMPGHSEDCLFANVWTPSHVTGATKLPVWVFIQGGGYNSNSAVETRGSEIVAASGYNVVVVTFNYRVSLWGFLAGEAVKKDGVLNVGLHDQRKLLHWVQRHISKFGGDPSQVMIHGHSAGAGSVAHQLTAYAARNDSLFASALLQSPFFPPQPEVSEVEWMFNATAQLAGCNATDNSVMACLRAADGHMLQDIVNHARVAPGKTGSSIFYWLPVTDGDFVQGNVVVAMKEGRYVPVPLVAGTVNNEGSTFGSEATSFDDLLDFVSNNFPHYNSSWSSVLKEDYPLTTAISGHASWFPTTSQCYGDSIFTCPMLLSTQAGSGPSIWVYRYNVTDENEAALGLGVPHGADLPAFFGPSSTSSPQSYFTYNALMVELVMRYMISFARTKNPNTLEQEADKLQEWPQWRSDRRTRQVFELGNVRTEQLGDDVQQRCRDWGGLLGY